jgi:hypothetical protein
LNAVLGGVNVISRDAKRLALAVISAELPMFPDKHDGFRALAS